MLLTLSTESACSCLRISGQNYGFMMEGSNMNYTHRQSVIRKYTFDMLIQYLLFLLINCEQCKGEAKRMRSCLSRLNVE